MRIPALLLAAALLPACVYKIDVEQGNYVTQDAVANLHPGMSKAEVKQVLGTPLLTDIFHGDRWDYYFSNDVRGKQVAHKHLVVLFKNDKLASWSGDANPPRQRPVTSGTPPAGAEPVAPAPATAAPTRPTTRPSPSPNPAAPPPGSPK